MSISWQSGVICHTWHISNGSNEVCPGNLTASAGGSIPYFAGSQINIRVWGYSSHLGVAIDTKPAHYHRVYAHILENQPAILDVALEIFGSEEIAFRDFEALARRMTAKIDNSKKGLESISLL